MANKNKNKGKAAEREFAAKLGQIFNGPFIRVPNSGAMVGGSNADRKLMLHAGQVKLMKGDIITPDFMPKFVCECKSYKKFSFHHLVRHDCLLLDDWIKQTKDCIDEGDFWVVLIKLNGIGHFVCFDNKYESMFKLQNHVRYKDYIFTDFDIFFADNKDKVLELSS